MSRQSPIRLAVVMLDGIEIEAVNVVRSRSRTTVRSSPGAVAGTTENATVAGALL